MAAVPFGYINDRICINFYRVAIFMAADLLLYGFPLGG